MQRDLQRISNEVFDVLVIGGGIYGAWVANDAARRGLSVALVEKGDFGSGTSSNSLRIIHGGLRYLQHLDLRRMRQSFQERAVLMRIAPHHFRPLPVLVPTYRHSRRSRKAMALALWVSRLADRDDGRVVSRRQHLPPGRIISAEETLRIFPESPRNGLTGGAVWYDAQIQSTERFLMLVLKSAFDSGAALANYLKVENLLVRNGKIEGAHVRDAITQDSFDVRSRVTVNSTGPWSTKILGQLGVKQVTNVPFTAAFNLFVARRLTKEYAVGIPSAGDTADGNAWLGRGSPTFFISPWRNGSLIGTAHLNNEPDPDQCPHGKEDVYAFLERINQSCPGLQVQPNEVKRVFSGLLPARRGFSARPASLLRKHRIYDHGSDGIAGLISILGVKYTTARYVAESATDLVFKILDQKAVDCRTATTPLEGELFKDLDEYVHELKGSCSSDPDDAILRHLVGAYGCAAEKILRWAKGEPSLLEPVSPHSRVIAAAIVHSVRNEMAKTLEDVVCRRTDLGVGECPDSNVLSACANLVSEELGWNAERMQDEIENVKRKFNWKSVDPAEKVPG